MKTSVINQIKTLLGMEVKLETIKLIDGITVFEADTFETDKEVFIVTEDEQKIPVPVGEYELEDGRIVVVIEEGIIASITDVGAEAETTETPAVEKVTQKAERLPKRVVKSNVEEQHFANDKYEEDETAPEVAPAEAVAEVEEIVTEEIVAIINELTPEVVTEGDSSEIATDVVTAITEVLEDLPEEVSAKAFNKQVKYGKNKLSEEEAQVITDVADTLITAITDVVDASTPTEVTPEISAEIAETIIDAVTEIVGAEETLRKSIFRRAKKQMSEVKNSKVKQRVAQAQAKINLLKTRTKTSAKKVKPISFNPENTNEVETFVYGSKRPRTIMDTILEKINK